MPSTAGDERPNGSPGGLACCSTIPRRKFWTSSACRHEGLAAGQGGRYCRPLRALSDVAIYEDVFRRRGVDYYLVGGRTFLRSRKCTTSSICAPI